MATAMDIIPLERDFKTMGCRREGQLTPDWVVDDILSEMANGTRFVGRDPEAVYQFGKPIAGSGSCRIDGGGAKFLHLFNDILIPAFVPIKAVYTIVGIENGTAWDFSNGTVATLTEVTLVKLAETPDPAHAGQIGKVLSFSDLNPEVRLSDGNRKGEHVEIATVDVANKTIMLFHRLEETYTIDADTKLTILDQDARVEIRNLAIDARDSDFLRAGINPTSAVGSIVDNVRFLKTQGRAVQFTNCVNWEARQITIREARTWVATNDDNEVTALNPGYGVSAVSSSRGRVEALFAAKTRHAFSESPSRVATYEDRDKWWLYGKTYDIDIVNGIAFANGGVAWDVHDSGKRIRFICCQSSMPFAGPRNSTTHYGIRGQDNQIIMPKMVGGNGIIMYCDAADGRGRPGGHIVTGGAHYPHPGTTNAFYSVRVKGNAWNPLSRCYLSDFYVAGTVGAANSQVLRGEFGELAVAGLKGAATYTVATAVPHLIGPGFKLIEEGTKLDLSASTGQRYMKREVSLGGIRDAESWDVLLTDTGRPIGTYRMVSSKDAGTHTGITRESPTVAVAGVPNEGAYQFTAAGWLRLGSGRSTFISYRADLDLPAASVTASAIDTSGEAMTAHVYSMLVNRQFSEVGGVSLQSNAPAPGSDIFVDYSIKGSAAGQPSRVSVAVPASAAVPETPHAIALNYRGQPEILASLTSTVHNTAIGGISAGVRHGQRIVLFNANPLNTRSIRIVRTTAGLIDIAGAPIDRVATNVVLNGTITITGANGTFSGADVGTLVSGIGIPPNTFVTAVANGGGSLTLSQPATTSASGATVTLRGMSGEALLFPRQRLVLAWNANLALWTEA